MKKLTTTLLALALIMTNAVFAQFEGVIKFDKIKAETTKYAYYVKGDKVRIEDFAADGTLKGVMLVDLKNETITALSPERMLYMDATNKKTLPKISPKVNKTTNKKKVGGVECTEWIVSYPTESTEISYWVIDAKKDFAFFDKLLKVLNRKDKLSRYFIATPGHESRFTMSAVEKTSTGTKKTELKVTKMERKSIPDSKFEIPAGYQKFER